MNNQQYQCEKCKKSLANRHSLSRHKKTCQDFRGRKRASDDDDGTEIVSKNPKIQALADAIINDTKVDNNLPVADVFWKLPSLPSEVVDGLSSTIAEVVDELSSTNSTEEMSIKHVCK